MQKNAGSPSVQMLGGIGIPGGTPKATTVTSTYVTGADYNFLCDNADFIGKQINGVTLSECIIHAKQICHEKNIK